MNRLIMEHYASYWGDNFSIADISSFRKKGVPEELDVIVFNSKDTRGFWTFATAGFSSSLNERKFELHIHSFDYDEQVIMALIFASFFNNVEAKLDLDHTVNLGQPVVVGSSCEYGLISLPYLEGPDFETGHIGETTLKFYWFLPITAQERRFKVANGIEELEQKFEDAGLEFANLHRRSVV